MSKMMISGVGTGAVPSPRIDFWLLIGVWTNLDYFFLISSIIAKKTEDLVVVDSSKQTPNKLPADLITIYAYPEMRTVRL